jgi:mono/diheme cytochrome c family protein
VKAIFVSLLGVMVCGAAPSALHAQTSTPASAGAFTAPQAARGGTFYQSKCSSCHNTDLSGDGMAPPLAGPDFAAHWVDQPVSALFEQIHTAMPSDQPGTLSAQQVSDLIAFILSSNKYPAGASELPTTMDHLKDIVIDKAP